MTKLQNFCVLWDAKLQKLPRAVFIVAATLVLLY